MEIITIINTVVYVLAGASLALKYIAPLTKNKVDDKIYNFLIKILKFIAQDSDFGKFDLLEIKIKK